jgi:1-acyl-sn-glycerol-3-phosphate acyltransferase
MTKNLNSKVSKCSSSIELVLILRFMLNAILFIPRMIYKIYFLSFFVITLILFYPLFKWSVEKEERFPRAFKLMRMWSWWLALAAGISVKKLKNSPLPKGPFIICCNHSSYLDIVLMYRVFPEYFVMMGKGEIEKWRFFRVFFMSGMNILVHRDNNKKAHESLEQAKEKLDKGQNVVIFPEGGIHPHAPFIKGVKNGAFKLAIEKQVPIVPMTFETNWKLLQGTDALFGLARPGVCKVHLHEAIITAGMTDSDLPELRLRVKEAMSGPLQKHYHSLNQKN